MEKQQTSEYKKQYTPGSLEYELQEIEALLKLEFTDKEHLERKRENVKKAMLARPARAAALALSKKFEDIDAATGAIREIAAESEVFGWILEMAKRAVDDGDKAAKYLDPAKTHGVLVFGSTGCGKSTLSNALIQGAGALNIDPAT